MAKYTVEVSRRVWRRADFTVEATSPRAAIRLAEQASHDDPGFSEWSDDLHLYDEEVLECEGVQKVNEEL